MTRPAAPPPQDEALPPSIGRPATAALAAIGVTTLDQVAGWRERDLLAIHGVGPVAVARLAARLAESGRAFRAPAPAPTAPRLPGGAD